ncbi:uncharacterized protein [Hemitrygon akajei]|uniref:uncharacterized protein n=1 Tax=Hemitrygon akajei TaxID=2704970 RepID=UPI003BF989BC
MRNVIKLQSASRERANRCTNEGCWGPVGVCDLQLQLKLRLSASGGFSAPLCSLALRYLQVRPERRVPSVCVSIVDPVPCHCRQQKRRRRPTHQDSRWRLLLSEGDPFTQENHSLSFDDACARQLANYRAALGLLVFSHHTVKSHVLTCVTQASTSLSNIPYLQLLFDQCVEGDTIEVEMWKKRKHDEKYALCGFACTNGPDRTQKPQCLFVRKNSCKWKYEVSKSESAPHAYPF